MQIHKRGLEPRDRPLLVALLESLPAFTADEIAVALELIDHQLTHQEVDGYRFILGFASPGGQLAGYLCYGRTPMTVSSYDLYWLATSPAFTRSGVGRELVAHLEAEIADRGGGLVRVETGSREGHGAAVHFYSATGFTRAATIEDFYAPGDDLIIFTKRVRSRLGAGDAEDDAEEAALYDAAFGYRSFAAERDFFLACARKLGTTDVRRVLAFASGAGRHLEAFADAGISGVGTDPSPAMTAYAARLASARGGGPEVRFVRARLDERPVAEPPIPPVDLSFVALCSIHALATAPAIEAHLRVAADLLRRGGLHIIEATHPADLTPSGVHHAEWTEVRGDTTIAARFRIHVDQIREDRVVPVSLEVVRTASKRRAQANGGAKAPSSRLLQEEAWFVPDLQRWRDIGARVPELRLAAVLGDFNLDVPFEHPAAWRLILVFQKM